MATRKYDHLIEIMWMNHLVNVLQVPLPPGNTATGIMNLTKKGMITVSSFLEVVVAERAGVEVIREDSHDLSDGTEVKYATSRKRDQGATHSAKVSGLTNKTGTLRVMVLEKMTQQFYYFLIPHDEYAGKDHFEITFDITGAPRRIPHGLAGNNVWQYEVSSFDEMCSANTGVVIPHKARNLALDFLSFDNCA